jgi:hypothetical protein
MTATHAADLRPEGWIAGGRECEYCPFTKACGIERRSVPSINAEADPQFAAEVADLALSIRQCERARDRADEQARQMQDELKARLRAKGVRKIKGLVNWSHVKGRTAYDNKAIQAAAINAGIDIEQYSTVGEATDRLTISVTVPGEENQTAAAA